MKIFGRPTDLRRARRSIWTHRTMAIVWALLAIPTVLIWSHSILWVLLISLYANFVSHLGAAQAAQAQEVGAKTQELEPEDQVDTD